MVRKKENCWLFGGMWWVWKSNIYYEFSIEYHLQSTHFLYFFYCWPSYIIVLFPYCLSTTRTRHTLLLCFPFDCHSTYCWVVFTTSMIHILLFNLFSVCFNVCHQIECFHIFFYFFFTIFMLNFQVLSNWADDIDMLFTHQLFIAQIFL